MQKEVREREIVVEPYGRQVEAVLELRVVPVELIRGRARPVADRLQAEEDAELDGRANVVGFDLGLAEPRALRWKKETPLTGGVEEIPLIDRATGTNETGISARLLRRKRYGCGETKRNNR